MDKVLAHIFLAYMLGAYPEHIWLLYILEGMYMIPRKFYNMWNAKPLNEALYYLDFCWCMNFTGILFLGSLVVLGHYVTDNVRKVLFMALLGVSCGPITGANLVFPFVSCLFHDVNTMTSLFIHFMPSVVVYTFVWNTNDIRKHWSTIFHLSCMEEIQFFPTMMESSSSSQYSVFGSAILLYLCWFIPYILFMLCLGGMDLPKKFNNKDGITLDHHPKWDTVFHSTMRQGACVFIGKVFRGRSKSESLVLNEGNNFDRTDFMIYMSLHMIACVTSIVGIAYPCFTSQNFHRGIIAFAAFVAVTRGARRYTYYMTKMHSKLVRKQFAFLLEETKNE